MASALIRVDQVASIVNFRDDPNFVELLKSASASFTSDTFESELAMYLRSHPHLVDQWTTWSGDQRWTPSAYISETVAGWYDSADKHRRRHRDQAGATADFIHRMAVWLAERRVIIPCDESTR
jgi:hypothetical protein